MTKIMCPVKGCKNTFDDGRVADAMNIAYIDRRKKCIACFNREIEEKYLPEEEPKDIREVNEEIDATNPSHPDRRD